MPQVRVIIAAIHYELNARIVGTLIFLEQGFAAVAVMG